MRSSSISLKTVPLIWLGFNAVQLNTGRRNLVLMGFFILIAVVNKNNYRIIFFLFFIMLASDYVQKNDRITYIIIYLTVEWFKLQQKIRDICTLVD